MKFKISITSFSLTVTMNFLSVVIMFIIRPYRKNFLLVDVYFSELRLQVISQLEAFGVEDLMGNLHFQLNS